MGKIQSDGSFQCETKTLYEWNFEWNNIKEIVQIPLTARTVRRWPEKPP